MVGGAPDAATMGEDERVVRLLESERVLVHPGYFFDFPREGYLVVSLLTRPDVVPERHRAAAGRRCAADRPRRIRHAPPTAPWPQCRSARSPLLAALGARAAGIGEIGDLGAVAAWLKRAGLRALQLLPVRRCRPARPRPIRRSARWRSTRSTSAWPTSPISPRSAASRGCRWPIRRCSKARAGAPRIDYAPCDGSRSRRCGWRSACSGRSTGCDTTRAPDRLRRLLVGRRGGWTITRCSARSTSAQRPPAVERMAGGAARPPSRGAGRRAA